MRNTTRRDLLLGGGAALGVGGLFAGAGAAHGQTATRPAAAAIGASPAMALVPGAVGPDGQWALPDLDYPYDAVEDAIDAQTMEIHHRRHHNSYVNGLIEAEGRMADMRESGDHSMAAFWTSKVSFNGGGHFLHCIFWDCMGPDGGGEPTGILRRHIERDFGSVSAFKAQFAAASKSVEGSGWGILAYLAAGNRLTILQGLNQNLLSTWAAVPLLAIDVWEHAYYLRYQNNRGSYVDNWWKVVDWSKVSRRYDLLNSL